MSGIWECSHLSCPAESHQWINTPAVQQHIERKAIFSGHNGIRRNLFTLDF